MLSTLWARPVSATQTEVFRRALDTDPYATCLVAARCDEQGLTQGRLEIAEYGGQIWGVTGGRSGLCYFGSNIIPITGDARALKAFATVAVRRRRSIAALVGRAELVMPLWQLIRDDVGPAHTIRERQPLMICPGPPAVAPDHRLRLAQPSDLDRYFPAAVAMFREEIGSDPLAGDGGRGYRQRLSALISPGQAYLIDDGDEIIFKAEVGSMSKVAGMVQGVWVHPSRRGSGLGTAAMAAVVTAVQQGLGRTPVLYVNDFNVGARKVYHRVGFIEVATYASVLF